MNKIFQTHKNIKFICIGIMLSIISIVRYGFAVNIGNDNEFILPFLINPESLNTLNQDLIFQEKLNATFASLKEKIFVKMLSLPDILWMAATQNIAPLKKIIVIICLIYILIWK